MLKAYTIDDEIDINGGVEVTITLADGRRRWCFFMTPQALAAVGDQLPGTDVRIHFGAPHMVVVSRLDTRIIEETLRHLDARGELEACTQPLDDGAA